MEQKSGLGAENVETDGEGLTIEHLRREFRADDGDDALRFAPEQESEVLLEEVLETLGVDAFRFDEDSIKMNLQELLLVLVAYREQGSHGKGLMADIATIFETRISPGTLYPNLHELEDEGLLEAQELVRTKEYQVTDPSGVKNCIRTAMEQHLVLGLFFQAALEGLED